MLKVNSYSQKGVKTTLVLPKKYEVEKNLVLLAQAKRVYENLLHKGGSPVKTRSDVNASTRKIYRQKGTGRARHGAKSAPIFVGGGKAHGPTGEKRSLSLNKKQKRHALIQAINFMAKSSKLGVLADLSVKSTKEAALMIESVREKEKVNVITLVFADNNQKYVRFFKNIKDLKTVNFKSLNAFEALRSGYLLFDKACFDEKRKAKETGTKKVKKAKKAGSVKK